LMVGTQGAFIIPQFDLRNTGIRVYLNTT